MSFTDEQPRAAFDDLPDAELPDAALVELADELFRTYDAEEAAQHDER